MQMQVATARPVRVLVVDDSPLVRKLLTELLGADPDIEVVGAAADPFIARDKIKQLKPDVLTLDVEMPRMDGLTFLRNLMRLRPMPVVMVSTLTAAGAEVTLDALAVGAVDFIQKPQIDRNHGFGDYARVLVEKVKHAAQATVQAYVPDNRPLPACVAPVVPRYRNDDRVLAIGASTGGTEAVRTLMATLPADAPPVVIVQHIPASFSGPFAARLDRNSAMTVREAFDGAPLQPGLAYVAPGGRHLRIVRDGSGWKCRLGDDEPVRLHRPSVDVLFRSLAECAGARTSAALLTGMGDDGARGLLALREAGASTVAQDASTSVVWGMPGAAVAMGATDVQLRLGEIAAHLLEATLRTCTTEPRGTA